MENISDGGYVWLLIATCIAYGWVLLNVSKAESNYDFIALFNTSLYKWLVISSVVVLGLSLIILAFQISFLTMLLGIIIVVGTHLLNVLIIHPLYIRLFGYEGIGALLPIILSIILSIILFCNQFS